MNREHSIRRLAVCTMVAVLCTATGAQGAGLDPDKEIEPFVAEVSKQHGLDPAKARAVLGEARVLNRVLELISRPAEAKPWRDYRKIFMTERRIKDGVAFWKKNRDTLERARERFGVPEEIMVAIIGVETLYGQRAGNIRVLDALATHGFRYPKRSKFFSRELGHYLALGNEEGLDLLGVKGSYAGAMGIPQFIPSSYRAYSVDFDGDGRRDLISSVDDAIGSVGAYLGRHLWKAGMPITVPAQLAGGDAAQREALIERGIKPSASMSELAAAGVMPAEPVTDPGAAALIALEGARGTEHWIIFGNFYAITRYNHSKLYAMAVFQLAEAIAGRVEKGTQ